MRSFSPGPPCSCTDPWIGCLFTYLFGLALCSLGCRQHGHSYGNVKKQNKTQHLVRTFQSNLNAAISPGCNVKMPNLSLNFSPLETMDFKKPSLLSGVEHLNVTNAKITLQKQEKYWVKVKVKVKTYLTEWACRLVPLLPGKVLEARRCYGSSESSLLQRPKSRTAHQIWHLPVDFSAAIPVSWRTPAVRTPLRLTMPGLDSSRTAHTPRSRSGRPSAQSSGYWCHHRRWGAGWRCLSSTLVCLFECQH